MMAVMQACWCIKCLWYTLHRY